MRRKIGFFIAILAPLCFLCGMVFFFLPPVHDRLAWRIDELLLRIRYSLNPPGEAVFVPTQQTLSNTQPVLLPSGTPLPLNPSPTLTLVGSTETPEPTPTSTLLPTPLPLRVDLKGVRYETQHGGRQNYCAPANLSMALSFWGWKGNLDIVGPVLKPDVRDKNVMPYEMVDYVRNNTNLSVVLRVGGDLDTLKRFLAAGYPVLIEKGVYFRDMTGVVSWMGHFQVVTGYDETGGYFIAQDSFVKADAQVLYDKMLNDWRAFNDTYMVIYSKDKEPEVITLLGPDADETVNYQNAAAWASNEIMSLTGIDQYFAWFNRGTNLVQLQDYAGAAEAYDKAFAIYPTIPEADRPWRMLWYQTGPYWAYYYSQRYYDTLYLADGTLNAMQSDRNLEESYYWRGMARAALGDIAAAIQDFQLAVQYHPGFEPAVYQLQLLGVNP
jgi:hypothetical protein